MHSMWTDPYSLEAHLLLRGQVVEGPRQVALTTRPVRQAYLVDPSSPVSAFYGIGSACLEWGGLYQFLIPCKPGERPEEQWETILRKMDPDIIIDLVGIEKDYYDEQTRKWSRTVVELGSVVDGPSHVHAIVFGALRRQTGWVNVQAKVLNLSGLPDHSFGLPLAYRVGYLNPHGFARNRPIDEHMPAVYRNRSANYEDFVDLRTVAAGSLNDRQIHQLLLDLPLAPLAITGEATDSSPAGSEFTLPWLTTVGIFRLSDSRPGYDSRHPRPPEVPDESDAYWERLVVVSSPDSVPDLCLAWNLRAQRLAAHVLPHWLPAEWLTQDDVLRNIQTLITSLPKGLGENEGGCLASASLSADEMSALATRWGEPVTHREGPDIARLFRSNVEIGATKHLAVNFREGRGQVPSPDYEELANFDSAETVGWSLRIQDYTVPVEAGQFGWPIHSSRRLAFDGVASTDFKDEYRRGGLIDVSTADGWRIASGLAYASGYRIEPSADGRLGLALMRMLGERGDLALLASSRVYELFREMADIVPHQAVQRIERSIHADQSSQEKLEELREVLREGQLGGGQFDRQHMAAQSIGTKLGTRPETTEVIIRRLVGKGLLLRGFEVQCPLCRVTRWYPVARLGDIHHCDACQAEMPLPLRSDVLPWRYRLNELVARGIDQGVVVHLLAVHRILQFRSTSRGGLLGVFPGVELKPEGVSSQQPTEVDLFVIYAGRTIVGECKASDSLSEHQALQTAETARLFDCSRLIFASATDFASSQGFIERVRAAAPQQVVETWTAADLFDEWDGIPLAPQEPGADRALPYLNEVADTLENGFDNR